MTPRCCPSDYAGLFKWQQTMLGVATNVWTMLLAPNPNRVAATFSSPAPGGVSIGLSSDPTTKVGVIVGSTWGNWECTFDHYGTLPSTAFWGRSLQAADNVFVTEIVYCGDIGVFGAPSA